MKKSESMAEMVFQSIDRVVSAVENIHDDIAEAKSVESEKRAYHEEKRKKVYGLIKSINGRVEEVVLGFCR